MKTSEDPVDHARTTRSHAGETMTDIGNMPALAVLSVSLVLFVTSLVAFATYRAGIGMILGGSAAVGFVIGLAWLALEHRRVRRIEDRWYAEHPDEVRQPPNS
ncbi:MAG: LapA family protein [Mycobacterium sp.]|nr:LapA family protein [Mycobacterium sp.]